eukprot:1153608-Pelagomonas_calceolata.AAC.2
MASPLDYDTQCLHYWSSGPRDILFGAQHSSLSSIILGVSICHPIYDKKATTLALRHAIYSAILHTEATATFMFLPASAKEGKKEHNAGTSTAPAPNPKITYLPNLQNALMSHMHTKHRLGYANPKIGYYSYYQSLLPH